MEEYYDRLVSAYDASGQIRAYAIVTKDLVEEARVLHNSSPICTAALGRLMSATLILGSLLKSEEEVITIQLNGDGPMKGVLATANCLGEVKGYCKNPYVIMAPNASGHLNVGGAIGKGTLTLIRDYAMKEPYVSSIPLHNGEIAEDLTYFFATSEQTPTSVGLGVFMNKDNTVKTAGGFLVQLMPDCSEEMISQLEKNLAKLGDVSSVLAKDNSPEALLDALFDDMTYFSSEAKPVKWKCGCSKEKSKDVLMSIGKKELEDMASENKSFSVGCQFCGKEYEFTHEEIAELAAQAK